VAVVLLATACTDDSNVVSSEANETGGQAGDNSPSTGGVVSSSGGARTGGQGGSVTGGTLSTGGTATGGSNPGGTTASGGTPPSGGAPTGGIQGDGGTPTGGVAGSGGTTGSGGTSGAGGTVGSGGVAGESGAPNTGGTTDTGGAGGAGGSVSDLETRCLELGGTIQSALCCQATGDFPNLCLTGPCGCAPEYSREIRICSCPENRCFNGEYCLEQDPGQVYVLWQAPGGVAGTGPALELLEDGTLRLWEQTSALSARDTAGWDYEFALSFDEQLEIVNLLSDVDYSALPHPGTGGECYPSYYFESTVQPSVSLSYANASALQPELDAVYVWLDAFVAAHAPDYQSWLPSTYCGL
jgi:hypothetical protein